MSLSVNSNNVGKEYDYVIVGGGPTGLTLAWILGEAGKTVLLLEREKSLGGCHRVRRTDQGLFTEHGPRIYLSNAGTTKQVLARMGIDFNSLFVPYNFSFTSVGGDSIKIFKFHEIFAFIVAYIRLMINPNGHGRDQTMEEFMKHHDFTEDTSIYLDNLCRLTDGAGADKYTLFEFLQLLNQHIGSQVLQPKRPNDLGLFKLWNEKLLGLEGGSRVDIQLNNEVVGIDSQGGEEITAIQVRSESGALRPIKAKNYIFAIPSQAFLNLLLESRSVVNAYGDIQKLASWHQASKYNVYIPIVFHWNRVLELPKVWGFPSTDWGIAYIVLTDYMTFDHSDSKTVISTCITKVDTVSSNNNKTANQSSEGELIDEVFEQLRLSYPELPEPTHALLSSGVYRDSDGKWATKDQAFILSTEGYQTKLRSSIFKNMYWVGTHSGYHKYHFTSLESAVSNGVALAHRLAPESRSRYKIHGGLTLVTILYFVLILIIGGFFYFWMRQTK